MASVVDLSFDEAQFAAAGNKIARQYVGAAERAIGATTRALEQRLEELTRSAVPGRLWRAWKSRVYRNENSSSPAGIVYVAGKPGGRARGAMTFWSRPGAIRGKNGQFLAIPLPAAGSRGRSRMLTPVEWEARHNVELRPVFRPGRAPLLVADGAVLSGRAQVARPMTGKRRESGRGATTVPIFVLLPTVKFRNAFSIAPIAAESERALVRAFLAEARAG